MTYSPDPAYKAQPEKEEKPSHLRLIMVALATCALVAGAGFHYAGSNTGNPTAPLAGGSADQNGSTAQPRPGVQFSLIAPDKAAEALAMTSFSEKEKADILAGVKRRELRLVAMPIFDATGAGGTVTVACGTMHQTVLLQPKPTVLILPITVSGNVDIIPSSDPGAVGIGSGVVTMFGPQALPIMHQGDTLGLTVIAQ
ncbi:hypothetical protein [Acetobacter persici]